MYEIVMPQLSDSMEEGKLISWKVNEGSFVKSGDVIAEVESDKAIMEIETFKDGVVKSIKVKPNEIVAVGTIIAEIDTDSTSETLNKTQPKKETEKKEEKVEVKEKENSNEEVETIPKISKNRNQNDLISPKARLYAEQNGVDIENIIYNTPNRVINSKDVDEYLKKHYFTEKAIKLINKFKLNIFDFELNHKIDSDEVNDHISKTGAVISKPLTPMQKAISTNVLISAKKPIYHIYESIDAEFFNKNSKYSVTTWIIKIVGNVMMKYENFRSKIVDNSILTTPNSNISIAVADKNGNLYMPVIKSVNKLSIQEIQNRLKEFKEKLKNNSFTANDMKDSNFGISNLGMLGIERFDAMINGDDSGIVAVGAEKNGKISITFTLDHRLINGYEAAMFVNDIKKEIKNV